jgi:cytochrome bd-type quinol oxidase subunit 2
MFRKLRKLLIIPFVMGALLTPALVPAIASAGGSINTTNGNNNIENGLANNLCSGSNFDLNGDTNNGCTSGTSGINTLLGNIINIFSLIVGAIAVIMIIVGGLRYVISSGNDQAVSGAKNTIIFALVGLVIVALAQFLVHFVIGNI